jgi:capsular polysaccharide biosynthesis protein
MLHALKLVTDNKFQIMELHLLNAVKSSKTIVAKDSFSGNELISGAMVTKFHYNHANLIALRNFFEQHISTNKQQTNLKLIIIRQSGQRNILNRDQLVAAAQAQGFLAVEPEKLSFMQQVELFRSASVIVGPTGAWLANLLFIRKGVKVKVLYPSTCKTDISIWMKLGEFLNIPVADYYFDDIILNQYQPIHSDFTVDMATFNQLLKE